MSVFVAIIISTFTISLISFAGALFLFLKEKILNKILLLLVSFSAGALLGVAFFDLLPEAIAGNTQEGTLFKIFLYLIFGFSLFFFMEQFVKWHHHHTADHPEITSFSYLILVSDGLHNFIDGLVIAGAFIADFRIGIITSLAVIFHEIPKEIGNFAVLVYGGFGKIKALFLNFISAIAAILGGVLGFFILEKIGDGVIFLLSFTAGSFIYIAASDLIPEIKQDQSFKKSALHFLIFLGGIATMILLELLIK